MPHEPALPQAEALLEALRAAGLTVATAESCTGGLIAAALTAIPGSSDAVLGGLVTYSNGLKERLLGVPALVLETEGAVSDACARAMAEGARRATGASVAVAVTGIAGPGGGSESKPVGLVFLALAREGRATRVQRHLFPGDRAAIRAATVLAALAGLLATASDAPSG